jgi:predicted nucleotidyltransferase
MTTLPTIIKFCESVAREFRPQKIVLFSSYAYGRPTDASDVDLLVIMPHHGDSIAKAVEIETKLRVPFPLDLLVRTPRKVQERLSMNDWFIRDILAQGRVLYEITTEWVERYRHATGVAFSDSLHAAH